MAGTGVASNEEHHTLMCELGVSFQSTQDLLFSFDCVSLATLSSSLAIHPDRQEPIAFVPPILPPSLPPQ